MRGREWVTGMPPGFYDDSLKDKLFWFFVPILHYLHKLKLFFFSSGWKCFIFGHKSYKSVNFARTSYTVVCLRCKKHLGGGVIGS